MVTGVGGHGIGQGPYDLCRSVDPHVILWLTCVWWGRHTDT
jgi:hypothetical protein